jgi:tetratricopeptide (TPR) repeat protein
MKRWWLLGLFWALAMPATQAETNTASARYQEAAVAFAEGAYDEAAGLYEELLAEGYWLPEVFYNLANARYRQGDVSQAILNYKRAEYLAPRNADVQHNLAHVGQELGGMMPAENWLARGWRWLSLSEWQRLAIGIWWLTALLICLNLLLVKRYFLLKMFIFGLVLSGVFLWQGIRYWQQLQEQPEVVVLQAGQEALFAPLSGAVPHFTLPEGSVVRVNAQADGWYRVRMGEREGWVRQSVVAPVWPMP